MTYLQVKDLKKTRELWQHLKHDRELIITKDGQPRAIMIGIEPDEIEIALREIRRALFGAAVERVRTRAAGLPAADIAIKQAIQASRKDRA